MKNVIELNKEGMRAFLRVHLGGAFPCYLYCKMLKSEQNEMQI